MMKDERLKQELERIVCSNSDISITFLADSKISLNRWLVTSSVENRTKNLIPETLSIYDRELTAEDVTEMECDLEQKWRFYVSDEKTSFYKRNAIESLFVEGVRKDQEKYIYSLCGLYCEDKKELLIHSAAMLPMPLRIWINGSLVLTGTMENFTKNHLFSYSFEQGINTILVEKPMCLWNRRLSLTPKFFSISICPMEPVWSHRLAEDLDEMSLLKQYLLEYNISMNRLNYEPGETIQLFITNNKRTEETVTIEIKSADKKLDVIQGYTNQLLEYPIGQDVNGILKVQVGSQYQYICVGAYQENIKCLTQRLDAASNLEILEELEFNAGILNMKTGFVRNALEPIHSYYSQPVLERLFLTETIFEDAGQEYDVIDGFKIIHSPIDQGEIVYHLQLPSGYEREKEYPLVVCLNYDDSNTHIPVNPFRILHQKSEEAIVMTVCGRSEYEKDVLYGIDLEHLIHHVTQIYHVDQTRIYLYGICTGARLGYPLIKENPYGFAAFFSVCGTSSERNSKEYEVPVLQLCHVDDMFYNGAAIMQKAQQMHKLYLISGFEHEELLDLYCNKNIVSLLRGHQRDKAWYKKVSVTGIRSIYTKPCYVIQQQNSMTEALKKLYVYLQIPLKIRARNYLFPCVDELTLENEAHMQENLIYLVKKGEAKIQLEKIRALYEEIESKAGIASVDSFLITCAVNPYQENRRILFVIYTDEQSLNRLCDLWSEFCDNEIFHAESILYVNESYHIST